MSRQKDSGDNIKPPEDSLSNYFDDLLGGEDLLEQAFAVIDERPMPVAAGGGSARVVTLPTKKNLEEIMLSQSEKISLDISGKKDRGVVLWPMRVALTNHKSSAGPFEIAEILGKKETIKRITNAAALL